MLYEVITDMNSADTAFILAAAGLVLLMTPGLALFYGGMVRNKNVLGTIMQSFILLGVITVEWVLIGYSMSRITSYNVCYTKLLRI